MLPTGQRCAPHLVTMWHKSCHEVVSKLCQIVHSTVYSVLHVVIEDWCELKSGVGAAGWVTDRSGAGSDR